MKKGKHYGTLRQEVCLTFSLAQSSLALQNHMTITKTWYNYSKEEITPCLNYVDDIINNDDFVQVIDQEIKMVKTIEKERRSYMTYAIKLQEERKEGIKEGILTTVRSMLEDGLSVERVAKIAKLPEEQVMENRHIKASFSYQIQTIDKKTTFLLQNLSTPIPSGTDNLRFYLSLAKSDVLLAFSLSADKVSGLPRLLLRQAKLFLAQLDALHQEGHITRQRPHGLHAFNILRGFSRRSAMDAVPVLTGGNGHARDGKKLIEFIKSCRQTATPGHNHACSHFHRLVKTGTEEQARQVSDQGSICCSVINRTAHDQTITFGKQRCCFIDDIIKHTFSLLRAGPTADAAMNCFIAHTNQFDFYTVFRKDFLHFLQSHCRVPLRMR